MTAGRVLLGQSFQEFAGIAESADRLRALPRYYGGSRGLSPYPAVQCNVPWVSVVLEANGAVRPCYFHRPVGNVREAPLHRIVGQDLPRFRATLRVGDDPVCQRCVCSGRFGLRSRLW